MASGMIEDNIVEVFNLLDFVFVYSYNGCPEMGQLSLILPPGIRCPNLRFYIVSVTCAGI